MWHILLSCETNSACKWLVKQNILDQNFQISQSELTKVSTVWAKYIILTIPLGVDITLPSASCTNNYKPLNIICGALNCCILNFGCPCGACIDAQKALCVKLYLRNLWNSHTSQKQNIKTMLPKNMLETTGVVFKFLCHFCHATSI
jgi:hypothetical protein